MKYEFIQQERANFPVRRLCEVPQWVLCLAETETESTCPSQCRIEPVYSPFPQTESGNLWQSAYLCRSTRSRLDVFTQAGRPLNGTAGITRTRTDVPSVVPAQPSLTRHRRLPPTGSTKTSRLLAPMRNGSRILPMSIRRKVGSIWRWSWTSIHGKLWAGQCTLPYMLSWCWMPCIWRSDNANPPPPYCIIQIGVVNTRVPIIWLCSLNTASRSA